MRTKLDKRFDNRFHESEPINGDISFKLDPAVSAGENDMNYLEKMFHYNSICNEIDEIIKDSKYKDLNTIKSTKKFSKLNKIQINEVYIFILSKIVSKYSKIDIWSILSDYFDILPNKFYNSLSNKLKNDLINELYKKYSFIKDKEFINIY